MSETDAISEGSTLGNYKIDKFFFLITIWLDITRVYI